MGNCQANYFFEMYSSAVAIVAVFCCNIEGKGSKNLWRLTKVLTGKYLRWSHGEISKEEEKVIENFDRRDEMRNASFRYTLSYIKFEFHGKLKSFE